MQPRDDDPEVRYKRLLATGMAPGMAEILAWRKAPGAFTEGTMMHRRYRTLADQFAGERGAIERLQENARKMGVSVNPYSKYEPCLAKFPYDPRACINPTDPVGQVKDLCKKYGWESQGAVNYKPPKSKGRKTTKKEQD